MQFTRKRIIYTIVVTLIVVFSTTFAVLMTLERMDYRNYLQGEYSKNMYELITSVDNIRLNLAKSAIAGSREQKIITFEEIYRHSSMANDKLHSLPIPQENIEGTSKFLAQVGDFCYSLVRASAEGRDLTDEEYNNLDRLKNESYNLQASLNNLLTDINQGKVKWGEIRKKASGVFAKSGGENAVSQKFTTIQKQVAQYPALIYDGPFSDNILEIKPKIYNEKDVTADQAKEVVNAAIGKDKIQNIELKTDGNNSKIDSYRFYVTIKGRDAKADKVTCEVSKKGGKIVYLLDSRSVGNATIDVKKAADIGTKYLENLGFKGMSPSYNLKYDNTVVINYIYKQDNVVIYPDQIKLKIALDDGSIVGIEAEKYLVSHEDNRKITAPKISGETAQSKISKRLTINNIRLAIVPTESNTEVLCYEFSGKYKQDNFIVYINASNGVEQRIIQIMNTPNGELTM
ncbi:germination protein YpeB [Clostridium omnivorum]|uniref:Germination protein YpeB n=1 Tax=Clostridium omnivorum TaxID=1604902 RepID=A0ABQ5N2G6_9CLOT|nr:germination protein YpeB [Clostridium sp. E14]GLC29403.1 germination protein YpeB [Clostridium sp. E14]